MLVGESRSAARAWVLGHAAAERGYRGAFLTGSTTALAADAELPPWSDVDVVVVVDGAAPAKLGKLAYGGMLVDVSHASAADLADVAVVARTHYLAPSFRGGHLLDDPTGLLRRLEEVIAPTFATLPAVLRRCDDVLDRAGARLQAPDLDAGWEAQLLGWLFPASLLTNAVVVAALRPPTVRLRYAAATEVLSAAGESGLYEQLVGVLGCAAVEASTVRRYLAALGPLFDAAARVPSSLAFAGDITAAARPVAIEGSRRLVDGGAHREAVFWLVVTWARCRQVLAQDTPGSPTWLRDEDDFREAVRDLLGIGDTVELARRTALALDVIPAVRAAAYRIARRTSSPKGIGGPDVP